MADNNETQLNTGLIAWHDLTVDDAATVRDFYQAVVGWEPEPVSMGDYDDYNMNRAGSGETVAGICHARGSNSALPPQWLIYVRVDDVEAAAARCVASGGCVIDAPRKLGAERMCVIADPAGAVMALVSP